MSKRRRKSVDRAGSGASARSVRRGPTDPPTASRLARYRPLLLAGVLVLGVLGLGAIFIAQATAPAYACDGLLQAPADAPVGRTIVTPDLGRQHVVAGAAKLRYRSCPPTSGDHYNARGLGPMAANVYGPDRELSPGGWVHNLEHGYLVALYSCRESCPSDSTMADLRRFFATAPADPSASACGLRTKVLVARFDAISQPFALLNWNRAVLLSSFDPVTAVSIARDWLSAPTAPEPRAC